MTAPSMNPGGEALPSPVLNGDAPAVCPSQKRLLLKTLTRHPIRVVLRGTWLIFEVALVALDYPARVGFRPVDSIARRRALWLQRGSRRVLRVLKVDRRIAGSVPQRGLMVSNHLSYLDVLVLSATTPCAFVAKSQVRNWPVFGWFARLAGTVFVKRESRQDVSRTADELRNALRDDGLVVLFPEGTSSDGQTVLPFKSALLAPASEPGLPLSAACLHYRLDEGSVADEVCYWRDMTLAPHLLNLLGKPSVRAHLSFAPFAGSGRDRKELARELHAEVLRLQATLSARHEKTGGP